ncbi:MAG TPA: hypothetical protein VLE99_01430 [Candidatus Saccharimonadales bacterium]|nr:hypothetical protein [Candidatus Saccharimonadales bacterium]
MAKAKIDKNSPAYLKHSHKLMVLLGLVIVLLAYNDRSDLVVIFGAMIMGVGVARIKDFK